MITENRQSAYVYNQNQKENVLWSLDDGFSTYPSFSSHDFLIIRRRSVYTMWTYMSYDLFGMLPAQNQERETEFFCRITP